MDRAFQALEEIFVVDDIAVLFVVAIQTIDPADRLEEAMILHGFVDIEIGGRGGVKAGEQLIDDDQQPHLPRLFDKGRLGRGLKGFGRLAVQHLLINGILFEPFGQPFARLFAFDVGGGGGIGGDNGALGQALLLKEFIELARLVDAAGDQHGVAA